LSGIITPMLIATAAHHANPYKVSTPVYQGPLDLLLQLIERAELDITKLALAQVTDQYLTYMKSFKTQDAEGVSVFLVIASKLLQIKSEALLPQPPIREVGEEDPGEELARLLIIYKRYKEVAGFLKERESKGYRSYLRLNPPPKIEATLDMSEFTIQDILEAARAAFIEADNRQELGNVVPMPKITIREKIGIIFQSLKSGKSTSFRKLLGNVHTRLDIVVTFLAMLELVKRHFIKAQQETLFGEITLETSHSWEEEIDFELEFGE
jgi:segregation and condensation protein A